MKSYYLIFILFTAFNVNAQNTVTNQTCELNLTANGFFKYSTRNHFHDLFPPSIMKLNSVKSAVIYYEKNPDVPSIHINNSAYFNFEFGEEGFIVRSEKDDIVVIYQSNSMKKDSVILINDNPNTSFPSAQKLFLNWEYFYFENVIQKLNQLYIANSLRQENLFLWERYQETILDEKQRIQRRYDYSIMNDVRRDTTDFYIVNYDEKNYFGTIKREKHGNIKDTIFFDKQWRPIAYNEYWMVAPTKKQKVIYNENNQLTAYNEEKYKPYSERNPTERGIILTLKLELEGKKMEVKCRKIFSQSTFIYDKNGLLERITQTTDEGICVFKVYYQMK